MRFELYLQGSRRGAFRSNGAMAWFGGQEEKRGEQDQPPWLGPFLSFIPEVHFSSRGAPPPSKTEPTPTSTEDLEAGSLSSVDILANEDGGDEEEKCAESCHMKHGDEGTGEGDMPALSASQRDQGHEEW